MGEAKEIALFEKRQVRRVWHKKDWWFSITDVVAALIQNERPRKYWNDLKKKIEREGDIELSEKIGQLKMMSSDGKKYTTDCANTATVLRIIQSIPSPKAEPFKQWLARIGKERIDEINDPELAMERMRSLYEKKGYTKEWIEKRSRGIAVRQELTTEWKDRGIKHTREFAILTNEIMQGTFDMKVGEYKNFKGLEKENLRDHMNDLELILTMLAEATTTKLHKDRDSKGFSPIRTDAKEGGKIAGDTRKQIEKASGSKISSKENHFPQTKPVNKQKSLH
ncbi:MAG: hypothetical protein UW68_C0002G0020 [Candidatus Collierbacteria bacterium GW2011_GWB1_44_6]|uniref:Bro-N domain-containing protein n=2 Tax=Candidatus Collieribacteriota TaxID=1752725 RepID=A0A0G1JQD1_9BACT|nr:MAG: hypothetical protein UV68_C0004G0018 [Candidatus Collierbacteria bacterium GW2011_GWC2_43_12]KKT73751.1 MAG: hypothetical protein UW68_C0002G0020 [Candidatus Collierbacteria bacterium GW2011_GWB1_44_6]